MNTKKLKPILLMLACVLALTPGLARAQALVQLTKTWELKDVFSRPESAVYDAQNKVIYVSNINGDGTAKDGNGYITKVSPDGKVVAKEWVGGLNAPKGLGLYNGKLYAADVDELVEINLDSATVTARYPAQGAQFLNDVTVDNAGNVYVSDSGTGTIYRLSQGNVSAWLKDDRVTSPNGLFAERGQLIVAASDSKAQNPGNARYMQSVSYNGRTIKPLKDETGLGAIDAVEPDGKGGYFLTDWGAGTVMYYTPEIGAVELIKLGQGTADMDYVPETDMIYLPVMMSDELVAFNVSRTK